MAILPGCLADKRAILAALAFLVCACAVAQETPVITGIVGDAEGKPVGGAHVLLLPGGSWPGAVAGKDGTFRMAFRRGPWAKADVTFHLLVIHPRRNLCALVALDDGDLDVQIVLAAGAALAGKVVGEDGKPLKDAKLSVAMQWPGWRVTPADPQTSAEDGAFRFPGLPPDQSFTITARAKGHRSARVKLSPGDRDEPDAPLGDLVLRRADLTLSGVVVDADGKPVPKALVRISGEGQPFLQIRTDDEGSFSAAGLVRGEVVLSTAALVDKKSFSDRTTAQAGAEDVRITLQENVPPSPGPLASPARIRSLAGKPLPAFDKLGLKVKEEVLAGKRILMCFWDMDERPSRRCVRMLGTRRKDLGKKGVLIFAVHARKVDKVPLDKWLARFNVTFDNGMIAEDPRTVRAAWGAKSLPWLILTDAEHVVSKEGFDLTELDALLASGAPE